MYQQVVGNAIAMHRDVLMPTMADRWPLWYQKTFVDRDGDGTEAAPEAASLGEARGERREPMPSVNERRNQKSVADEGKG